MEGIAVVVELDSPIVLNRPICIEGLLSQRMTERGERFDLDAIPVARQDGVWQFSQSMLIGPVLPVPVVFTRAARPGTSLLAEHLGPGKHPKVETKKRQTRNAQTEHQAYVSEALVWWGVGDFSRIADLLDGLREIGGKRAQGFGVVRRMSVSPLGPKPAFFGIEHSGQPVRPVPLAWWRARFPESDIFEAEERLGLPRWDCDPEPAALPDDLSISHHTFDDIIAGDSFL